MSRAGWARAAVVLATAMALVPVAPAARVRHPDKPAAADSETPPPKPAAPAEGRPFDGELLRLAELLGALTTMRQLCGAGDAEQWRDRMQALLDVEGGPPERRNRLAGAFNRGLQGYAASYRSCTANARLVIERSLEESARLARDVSTRYRAS